MSDTTGYGAPPADPVEPASPSMQDAVKSGVQRGEPENLTDQRRAFVAKLCQSVKEAKAKHEPAFKRMREDAKFVRKQRADQSDDDPRARVNVVQRHIAQRTASLYAKNPTFTADKRRRLEFAIWDGTQQAIQSVLQEMQAASQVGMQIPMSPMSQQLMLDIQQGLQRKKMLDGVGKTLELLMAYALSEQSPPFKPRAKRLVRRAITRGVGYLKLSYQRRLAKRPDIEAKLADVTDRLARIEQLAADLQDGEIDPNSAEAEELRVAKQQLESEPEQVIREGVVFDFPNSTRIIPDPGTTELVGWVNADWVAEEFLLSADEVQQVYGVDIGSTYTGYQVGEYGKTTKAGANVKDKLCCVWEIYHRKDGLVYAVVDGYPDFLKEPAPPTVEVEQFIPIYPLAFNDVENEEELFPPSDIEWLRPIQNEINRKRESLRQHRIANRPRYLGQKGKFEDQELKDLAGLEAHELLLVQGLNDQEKLENVIQRIPVAAVDPNLYETQSDISDIGMVVGSQDANLGQPSGKVSATGSSIAESSRVSSLSSNIDDLDDFLSLIARDCGRVLLSQMQPGTVAKVVGPGKVWPQFSRDDIAEEVYLDIEAGSSGRPNKEQELANAERIVPFLLQIPGISPEPLARFLLRTLDSRIDLDEWITASLPSILTMNRNAQVSTGDAATDPNAQAPAGAENAPAPAATPPGPQAAFPVAASTAQPDLPVPGA